MSDINKILGIRIRNLRNEVNMTQEELSEKANISLKHLGEIERGRGNPTLKNIEGLAVVFDMQAHELLNFGEFDKPEQVIREEVLARVKKMEPEALKILYMALRP